jgi:hypothetical protein
MGQEIPVQHARVSRAIRGPKIHRRGSNDDATKRLEYRANRERALCAALDNCSHPGTVLLIPRPAQFPSLPTTLSRDTTSAVVLVHPSHCVVTPVHRYEHWLSALSDSQQRRTVCLCGDGDGMRFRRSLCPLSGGLDSGHKLRARLSRSTRSCLLFLPAVWRPVDRWIPYRTPSRVYGRRRGQRARAYPVAACP